jgi:hypothetical protein
MFDAISSEAVATVELCAFVFTAPSVRRVAAPSSSRAAVATPFSRQPLGTFP